MDITKEFEICRTYYVNDVYLIRGIRTLVPKGY